MEVLQRIRHQYSTLSKTNKKIADYILKHSDAIVNQTSYDIGEKLGVSPSSVVRFAKKIDCSSLDDLKFQLVAELSHSVNKHIDPIVSKDDNTEELFNKVETLINYTVSDVFTLLDKYAFEKAAKAIKKANTVYLFGIGSSSLAAYDLFHKFSRAGKKASFVFDFHIGLESMNHADQNDVVLAVSYSGYTKEVILACKYAKEMGLHVIMITRNDSQAIRDITDEILLVPNNEHLIRVGAIASMYSSMFVGTTLYLAVIQEMMDGKIEKNMIITKNWIESLKERDDNGYF